MVHQVEPVLGFLGGQALEQHFFVDLAHNAHAGGAGAKAQEFLVRKLLPGNLQGAQNGCQGYRPGAFNIVVIDGKLVGVLVQQTGCIFPSKILKMDVQVGEQLFSRSHKAVHKGIVGSAHNPFVVQPQVQRVINQALAAGASIQYHRQHLGRVNAGSGGVHQDFPGGNADPVGAPVPDAQNAFPVGNYDQFNIPAGSPVAQGFFDIPHGVNGQVDGVLGSGEQFAVLLDAFGYARSIQNGQQLFQMMGEQVKEQGPVPAEQLHQIVALYCPVRPFTNIFVSLLGLEFQGFHMGRQNAHQPVFSPFFQRKGSAFVQEGIV